MFWRELRNPTPEQKMPRNYSFLDFNKDLVLQLAFVEQKALSPVPKGNENLDMKVQNLDDFICKASANAVASTKSRLAVARQAYSKEQWWDDRLEE